MIATSAIEINLFVFIIASPFDSAATVPQSPRFEKLIIMTRSLDKFCCDLNPARLR